MKKTWSTESVESTIGSNLDEADDILGDALRNMIDDPHSEFGSAGSIEINLSHGLIKTGTDPTMVHRMENSEIIKPNTETYLGVLSESKKSNELDLEAESYWKTHVETDEHKDAHERDTSPQFEES